MDDLVILGATVIDGSGAAGRITDVAVRAGRISAVEPRRNDSARREIDATGRVLVPGFIDIHTHSDFTLPLITHGPNAQGDRRVYAARTRFIPDSLLALFAMRLDVGARMREMWR